MRDDPARAFCSPLYARDPNTEIFRSSARVPSFPISSPSKPEASMLKPNPSSQQNHNSLPYRSGIPWAYTNLLPTQNNEPDLFDLMHRPQAKCVSLPEEEKERCTNSSDSDYVVLGPVASYMTPTQNAARITYLGRQYLPPVGLTNNNNSFSMLLNSNFHQQPQPRPQYPILLQEHQQQQQQQPQESVNPIPLTVQQVSAQEEKQADPSKHPTLSKVLNTDIRGTEDCKKLMAETTGPKYSSCNVITSISQLLTSTPENNNQVKPGNV